MLEKLEKTWKGLDQKIVVNKRELVLGLTACTLAGILVGILFSPKKTTTIGSHNGNNNTGNCAGALTPGDEDEAAEAEEE